MMYPYRSRAALAVVFGLVSGAASAQLPDLYLFHPQETSRWTDEDLLNRTVNPSREHRLQAWPAYTVIDNVHYVGTRNLGSFLITTPEGHILVNSTYPETLPLVRESVEELGYRWEDIEFVLGNHAHGDHMSGNAWAKEQTGAQVVAMAQDMPLLERMTPQGRAHPIDRVIEHGDTVELGGVVMTAHLTGGHTPGATAWTLESVENGETYDVVILGATVPTGGTDLTDPEVQTQFENGFRVQRSLSCDVPLGPHTPMYQMEEKYALLVEREGAGPNPFIDPEGCLEELYQSERIYYLRLRETLRDLVAKQGD